MGDASERDRCPECRGAGRVTLLTSSAPCPACGGAGRAAPAAGGPGGARAAESGLAIRYWYDADGTIEANGWDRKEGRESF
jgi:hypothetical protein